MHGRCLDNQESHGLGSRNEVLVGLTGWCRKLAAAFQDRVGIVPTGINFDGEDRLVYGDRDFLREHEDAAPSVIGAEHVAPLDGEEERPDTVYVPSERVTKRDAEVTLELRPTTGGDRALLAFTSLKELVEGCGDGQAWVAVRGEQVDDLRERSGADVVLWDAALPVEERKARFQEGKR